MVSSYMHLVRAPYVSMSRTYSSSIMVLCLFEVFLNRCSCVSCSSEGNFCVHLSVGFADLPLYLSRSALLALQIFRYPFRSALLTLPLLSHGHPFAIAVAVALPCSVGSGLATGSFSFFEQD